MSYFFVDVEADGPCPGLYSMVSFGAVKFDESTGRESWLELKQLTLNKIEDT